MLYIKGGLKEKIEFEEILNITHELFHAILFNINDKIQTNTVIAETIAIFGEMLFLNILIEKTNDYSMKQIYIGRILSNIVDNLVYVTTLENIVIDNLEKIKGEKQIKEIREKLKNKIKENDEECKIHPVFKDGYLKTSSIKRYLKDDIYYSYSYPIAILISLNMIKKFKNNKEYEKNILNAMKKSSKLNLNEILEILEIDLEKEETYDVIFKELEEIEKELLN